MYMCNYADRPRRIGVILRVCMQMEFHCRSPFSKRLSGCECGANAGQESDAHPQHIHSVTVNTRG